MKIIDRQKLSILIIDGESVLKIEIKDFIEIYVRMDDIFHKFEEDLRRIIELREMRDKLMAEIVESNIR